MTLMKNTTPRPDSITGNLVSILTQATKYGEFDIRLNSQCFCEDEFEINIMQHDAKHKRCAYEISQNTDEDKVHAGTLTYLEPEAQTTPVTTSTRDVILDEIARSQDIPTLDTQKSDSLDFHTISVWCLKEMLDQAFEAGSKTR
jgi:hypothetical protein